MVDERESSDVLSLGSAIKYIRERTFNEIDGRKFTQAELYKRCREAENPPPKMRAGVCFPSNDTKQQARVIRSFEKGKEDKNKRKFIPSPAQLRFIEYALNVSTGLLSGQLSKDNINRALKERDGGNNNQTIPHQFEVQLIPDLENPKVIVPEHRRVDFDGNRKYLSRDEVPNLELYPEAELSQRIGKALQHESGRVCRIALLYGPTGVGKTYQATKWIDNNEKVSGKTTVRVDCTGLRWEQIIRAISRELTGNSQQILDESLIAVFRLRSPLVLFLDGISLQWPSQWLQEQDTLPIHDQFTLSQIRNFVRRLATELLHIEIVLGVQSNRNHPDPLSIRGVLPASAKYYEIPVKPLTDEQGARLLGRLGLNHMSVSDLKTLSNRLEGLPIALVAASEHLRMVPPDQHEDYLIDLSSNPNGDTTYSSKFLKLVTNLKHIISIRSHPLAVLRLLALMPGSTPTIWIDSLCQEHTLVRLNDFQTAHLNSAPLPFVTVSGKFIDMHALVRATILKDLRDDLTSGSDPHVTRSEIMKIHLGMAQICFNFISSKHSHPTHYHLCAIEHILNHLVQYCDYLANDDTHTHNIKSKEELIDAIFAGDASRSEIIHFLWHYVSKPYLFDNSKYVTRVLGQYETKARILRYFFPGRNIEVKIVGLTRLDAEDVMRELSICYMHAGRLLSANSAIVRSLEHFDSRHLRSLMDRYINFSTLKEASHDERRVWLAFMDSMQQKALVHWRLGLQYLTVFKTISPCAVYCDSMLTEALELPSEKFDRSSQALVAGFRRVLARTAQIQFYSGRIEEAKTLFAKCVKIENLHGRSFLTGDAGRRHINSILRGNETDSNTLQYCDSLVQGNLEIFEKREKENKIRSNDIIGWWTLKAALLRLQENYDEADEVLRNIDNDEFYKKGEFPYYAKFEAELEQNRLNIAMNRDLEATRSKLRASYEELVLMNHKNLAYEFRLLECELVNMSEKRELVEEVEALILTYGWNLRIPEIELLKSGNSAFRQFGI